MSDVSTSPVSPEPRPSTRDRLGHWVRHSGILQPTTLKVLVFTIACLVVLAGLAAKIGNISFFASRAGYYADLSDATGLQSGDEVKIAGVTVGQVSSVTVQRAHALVAFSLDSDIHVRADTQVGTQWHNVLGQQFLYLYPGNSGPMLKTGGTLPLSQNVASANVGALLNSLGPLLGALNPNQANEIVTAFADALSGDQGQIDQLIDNAATVSQTVGSVDTQVGSVIDNLDSVFSALSQRSGDLGSVIDNLDTVTQSLASRNSLLDQTVSNLGQVATEVSTLEANTGGSLSTAVTDLQAVSADIEAHDNDLSEGLSTIGSGLATYSDISNYGQWFQVQTVYVCLADETGCTYEEPTNAPSGSGVLGGVPGTSLAPANDSSPLQGSAGSGASGTKAMSLPSGASLLDVWQMAAGEGDFAGSPS